MVSHFDEYVYIWFNYANSNQAKDRIVHINTIDGDYGFGLIRIAAFEPKLHREQQNEMDFYF